MCSSATARNAPPAASPGPSVRARPVSGTRQLADVIEKAIGRHGAHHPATQTFQALRIAVNGELEAVEKALPLAVQALGAGREAGGHQLPLAGGPAGQRVLPPGKQGLHLPARAAGLHLRA